MSAFDRETAAEVKEDSESTLEPKPKKIRNSQTIGGMARKVRIRLVASSRRTNPPHSRIAHSIAPTAALVYQPITDESFWAEKSSGAWLQDKRLRVSARRHLDESLIATGIPFANRGNAVANCHRLTFSGSLDGVQFVGGKTAHSQRIGQQVSPANGLHCAPPAVSSERARAIASL